MRPERLAVYTTAYPGVERYLADWYRSVEAQTDGGFELLVALDSISPDDVVAAIGKHVDASWFRAAPGATPARLRSDALLQLVEEYPAVVLVDSDDVLLPTRVAAARAMLESVDVAGCALEVMDEAGRDLGIVFGPADADPGELLPRWNVFGMSNTAWRSRALRSALPVPDDCVLIDWLLVTRAWADGARLGFDPTPRMRYRQYHANLAPMLPPFDAAQVLEATRRVLGHYRLMLDGARPLPEASRRALESARQRVAGFEAAVGSRPARLDAYVEQLNGRPPERVWWWQVAHPRLEQTWSS